MMSFQEVEEFLRLNRLEEARALCEGLLADARKRRDAADEAQALLQLSICLQWADRLEDAFAAALQAAATFVGLDNLPGEARARALLSRIAQISGDSDEALKEGLSALATARRSGDVEALGAALLALANVHLALGQWEDAILHCEQAVRVAHQSGAPQRRATALDTLGCIHSGVADAARKAGDLRRAEAFGTTSVDLSRQAFEIARDAGIRRLEGTALANVAEGLAAMGRPEEAQALLSQWPIDTAKDAAFTITHHLSIWAVVCMKLGRPGQAVDLLQQALSSAESNTTAMLLHEQLAEAFEQQGDPASALSHYKRFHAMDTKARSEMAQRSARVAAVRLQTAAALEQAGELQRTNEDLSRRTDDLLRLTLEDPLTGLPNRRALDKAIKSVGSDWALALIDIDHFKQVNDNHSHLVGDAVLQELANVLRRCCRGSDLPLRWGGEEFAILLGNASEPAGVAAAERVRAAVEAFDWTVLAPGLAITVSIGVAFGSTVRSVATVLAEADVNLYAAKHSGRNRVMASPLP